jgi:hypothetical protein
MSIGVGKTAGACKIGPELPHLPTGLVCFVLASPPELARRS